MNTTLTKTLPPYLKIKAFVISKGVPANQTICLTSELVQMVESNGWTQEFEKYQQQ